MPAPKQRSRSKMKATLAAAERRSEIAGIQSTLRREFAGRAASRAKLLADVVAFLRERLKR